MGDGEAKGETPLKQSSPSFDRVTIPLKESDDESEESDEGYVALKEVQMSAFFNDKLVNSDNLFQYFFVAGLPMQKIQVKESPLLEDSTLLKP